MNADPTQKPRLNPFVFPSETDFRFVLLVLTTIGGSLFCFERLAWFKLTTQPDYQPRLTALAQCFGAASAHWLDDVGAVNGCMRGTFGVLAVSTLQSQLVGLGLVLLFVVIVYSLLPTVMIIRERLVPLADQPQSQALGKTYSELCKEVGMVRPPQLMLKATSRGIGPRIFGCWGRYRIVVPGGLALRFQDDPATFRAVMLHELGHLKNRDVDKTYLAFAMGLAFVVIGFLPMMGVSLWGVVVKAESTGLWQTAWRGIVLLGVMYLTLTSVVRSREYYADLQASRWDPTNDRLAKLLQETLGPQANSWQTKLLRLTRRIPLLRRQHWDYALQFHPDPQYRAQILTHTDDLFHLDFWVALGTGLATTLVSQQILGAIETVRQFSPFSNPEYGFLVVGLIFGPVIAGICALGLWRMAFAQMLHPQATWPVGQVGLGLALGMVASRYLAFEAAVLVNQIDTAATLLKVVIFNLLWAGLLSLCMVCFAYWVNHSARLWLPSLLGQGVLRWVYRLGMGVASLVMILGLGWLLLVRDLGQALVTFGEVGVSMAAFALLYISYLALHPFTLVVCTLLWVFPLSAWLWQRRPGTQVIPGWAFLDETEHPPAMPVVAQGKPIFHSFKRGILGGVAFVAMLLLLRILLRRLVPEVTRESDGFALFLYYGVNLGIAVLIQWIVALFTPRHPSYTNGFAAIHGLLSVAVSGLIMVAGILWLNVIFGGSLNAQFVKDTLLYTLNLGTMVALPTLLFRVGIGGRG